MFEFDEKDPYHRLFYDETMTHIDTLEHEMINWEKSGVSIDPLRLQLLFRTAHAIKGACATLNLAPMVEIAHELENHFDWMVKRRFSPDAKWFTLALRASDVLKTLLYEVKNHLATTGEFEAILKALKNYAPKEVNAHHLSIQVVFSPSAVFLGIKAMMIHKDLTQVGKILEMIPSSFDLEDQVYFKQTSFIIETDLLPDAIIELVHKTSEIENVQVVNKQAIKEPVTTEAHDQPSIFQNNLKISYDKVNHINGMIESLLTDKWMLKNIIHQLEAKDQTGDEIVRLMQLYNHLDQTSEGLRNHMQDLRLLPLKTIFDRLPRIIRDLSHEYKNDVDLKVYGEDIGIDRHSLEMLYDPLVHLIRNAFSHGFKNRSRGIIQINVEQVSNHVIITFKDDGNGIDFDRIKNKALSENLLSPEEASTYTQQDWLTYIFRPHFTTTQASDLLSGRGVGLDVVKSNLLALKGTIHVESLVGEGTMFVLKLPISQSVTQAIIIKTGGFQYALPLLSVHEVIEVADSSQKEIEWQDQKIPLVRMVNVMSGDVSLPLKVLIFTVAEKNIGLVVDEVLREEQIVVQSMTHLIGPHLIIKKLPLVSGVSLLSDGTVAYTLNPKEVGHESFNRR